MMIRSAPKILAGLFLWAISQSACPATEGASLTLAVRGGTLEISGRVPASLTEAELRIESDRNARMSKISDVSPLTPKQFPVPPAPAAVREIYYPVVDVALQPGMEGVLVFSATLRVAFINQHFYKSTPAPSLVMKVPGDHLSFWENAVCVEPADVALQGFHLRLTVPVIHGGVHRQIELLSAQWSGRVTLHGRNGEQLAEASIATAATPAPAPPGDPLSPARLRAAVAESAAYVLRSQERNPGSPVYGGLNLFYDVDAATYRSNYWIWGWGPAVSLLLDAGQVPEIAARFAPGQLGNAATQIGRASLRFMVEEPAHPSRGVTVSRWNRNLSFASGFEERISVADAQFLAGWAWLPLYRATGDKAFLAAATTLAEATDRLSREQEVIPQDYYEEQNKFSDHILDESGFGMLGLAELYMTTKGDRHREIGRKYFESVRTKLQRPDGLWHRGWNRLTGVMPAIYVTRGMGWAMEGLLAAHLAMPNDGYLKRATEMAEHLMRWQHPDGSWSFNADKPVAEVGVGEKATALWSLLFYKLHAQTGDPRHLAAARQALRWCVENQYFGPDPEARGAIICVSPASAVGYRAWFRVTCTYTSAFFGLAALEELKRARQIPAPEQRKN